MSIKEAILNENYFFRATTDLGEPIESIQYAIYLHNCGELFASFFLEYDNTLFRDQSILDNDEIIIAAGELPDLNETVDETIKSFFNEEDVFLN